MPNARRPRLLAAFALLLLFTGCSSLGRVPLSDPSYESKKMAGSSGLPIEGYSSPDGVFHGFDGKAWWTGSAHDSLVLVGRRKTAVPGADPSGDPEDKHPVTLRFARSDVTTLLHRAPDGGKTGVLGLGIVTTLLLSGTVLLFTAYALSEGGWD